MSTGDEEADRLVDDLFREVDDQFADLEREYHQAREGLASADDERRDAAAEALVASNERFELMSQVATLQAEVSRQRDELDERDRMLTALGDKVAGFEADIANRDQTLAELKEARQEAADARREQARLAALLDARAAERQELVEVAGRLQNERDNVQELLTTALVRFDEAEAAMARLDDKVRHLEAARDTAAREHDSRAHELIESRAEMSKLSDRLAELAESEAGARERADRSDALAERRTNEAGYLNRRIEALTEKLEEADGIQNEATRLRRELSLQERRITDLERDLDVARSEANAANAAVEAIAERTSDYDELVAEVERLKEERDAAWEAASGYPRIPDLPPAETADPPEDVTALADQARELGGRRAGEAELAARAAEDAAAEAAAAEGDDAPESGADEPVGAGAEPVGAGDEDLHELDDADVATIEDDLAVLAEIGIVRVGPLPEVSSGVPPVEFDGTESLPRVDLDSFTGEAGPAVAGAVDEHADPADVVRVGAPPPPGADPVDEEAVDTAEIPTVDGPDQGSDDAAGEAEGAAPHPVEVSAESESAAAEPAAADVAAESGSEPGGIGSDQGEPEPEIIPLITLDHLEQGERVALGADPTADAGDADGPEEDGDDTAMPSVVAPGAPAARKRTILPADLEPNTPEAVAHLLNQPGVTAIVDARSTCGRTGMRPSELFDRVAKLRDHFDVPFEVVVTPVSTPVGGAPDLPAIGVHHVTGADTVADRVRALCMGLPADQPLVVIAGDDHVRRAAIGEEANVVEPTAVLNLVTAG